MLGDALNGSVYTDALMFLVFCVLTLYAFELAVRYMLPEHASKYSACIIMPYIR